MHTQVKGPATLFLFPVLVVLCLGGCYPPSALQQDFGQAWLYNQEVQLVNPQAGLQATPVTGLPPEAGRRIMEAYNKSFERQEKPEVPKATIVELGKK